MEGLERANLFHNQPAARSILPGGSMFFIPLMAFDQLGILAQF
jgi:hypothetical protein